MQQEDDPMRTVDSLRLINHVLRHYTGDKESQLRLDDTVKRVEKSKMRCLGTAEDAIGRGLVATRRIEPNEVCALYSGTIRSYDEIQRSERLLAERKQLGTYLLSLGGSGDDALLARLEPGNYFDSQYVIDGRGPLAEAAQGVWANHQCNNRIVYFDALGLPLFNRRRATRETVVELGETLGTTSLTFFRLDKLQEGESDESVLETLNANFDRINNDYLECAPDEVRSRWTVADYVNVATTQGTQRYIDEPYELGELAILVRYYNARFALIPPALTAATYVRGKKKQKFHTEWEMARTFFVHGQASCVAYALLAERRIEEGEEIIIDYGAEYRDAQSGNFMQNESLAKYYYTDKVSPPSTVASQLLENDVRSLDERLRDNYDLLVDFLLETATLLLRRRQKYMFSAEWYTEELLARWLVKYELPADGTLKWRPLPFNKLRELTDQLANDRVLMANDCARIRRRLLRIGCIGYMLDEFFDADRGYHSQVAAKKHALDEDMQKDLEKLRLKNGLGADNLYKLIELMASRQEDAKRRTPLEESNADYADSHDWLRFSDFHALALSGGGNVIFRDVFHLDKTRVKKAHFPDASLRNISQKRLLEASHRDAALAQCTELYARIAQALSLPTGEDYATEPLCESVDVLEAHFVSYLFDFIHERRLRDFLLVLLYYKHLNLTLRLLPVLDLDKEWYHRLYEKNYRRFRYAHQMLVAALEGDRLLTEVAPYAVEQRDLSETRAKKRAIDDFLIDPLDETLQRYRSVKALRKWAALAEQHQREAQRQRLYNAFNFAPSMREAPECKKSLGRTQSIGDGILLEADGLRVTKQFNADETELAAREFDAYSALMAANLLSPWFLRPYGFCRNGKQYRLTYERFEDTADQRAPIPVRRRLAEDLVEEREFRLPLQTLYSLLQVLQRVKLRIGLSHDDLVLRNVGVTDRGERFVIYDFDHSHISEEERNDQFSFTESGTEAFRSLLVSAGVFYMADNFTDQLEELRQESLRRDPTVTIVPLSEKDMAPYPHDDPEEGEVAQSLPPVIEDVLVAEEAEQPPVYRAPVVECNGYLVPYGNKKTFRKESQRMLKIMSNNDDDEGFFSFLAPEYTQGGRHPHFGERQYYFQVRWLRDDEDTAERLNQHYVNNLTLGRQDHVLPLRAICEDHAHYDLQAYGQHILFSRVVAAWSQKKRDNFEALMARGDHLLQITRYRRIPSPVWFEPATRGARETLVDIIKLYRSLRRQEGLLCQNYQLASVGQMSKRLVLIKLDDCVMHDRYKLQTDYVLGGKYEDLDETQLRAITSMLSLFYIAVRGTNVPMPGTKSKITASYFSRRIAPFEGDLTFSALLLLLEDHSDKKAVKFIVESYNAVESKRRRRGEREKRQAEAATGQ